MAFVIRTARQFVMQARRVPAWAALLSVLAIGACGGRAAIDVAPSRSTAAPIAYVCSDGARVTASYPDDRTARVTIGDRTIAMRLAMAASGARYVGGTLQWWTRGMTDATLSVLKAGETVASGPSVTCKAA